MEDFYLGQIQLFPFNFEPKGWKLCNGSILQIKENLALYNLIGTKFGGDGSSTYALPNLSNLSPVPKMQYYIAFQGRFPVRTNLNERE
jgi:microcystin-dependent protein